MKFLKTFESYKLLEGISPYKFANNLEALATNRLLTKEERENLANPIYNKIGRAAMGINDKLMVAMRKQGRTEITPEDYEASLVILAGRLKRELMPPDYIPNDEPDPNIQYTYTNEEPEDLIVDNPDEED